MHTISVEELENLDPSNITILDIRSEEDSAGVLFREPSIFP